MLVCLAACSHATHAGYFQTLISSGGRSPEKRHPAAGPREKNHKHTGESRLFSPNIQVGWLGLRAASHDEPNRMHLSIACMYVTKLNSAAPPNTSFSTSDHAAQLPLSADNDNQSPTLPARSLAPSASFVLSTTPSPSLSCLRPIRNVGSRGGGRRRRNPLFGRNTIPSCFYRRQ